MAALVDCQRILALMQTARMQNRHTKNMHENLHKICIIMERICNNNELSPAHKHIHRFGEIRINQLLWWLRTALCVEYHQQTMLI